MAINITDEALDSLEASSEDERNSYIDSLSDEDAATLLDAVKKRKAAKVSIAPVSPKLDEVLPSVDPSFKPSGTEVQASMLPQGMHLARPNDLDQSRGWQADIDLGERADSFVNEPIIKDLLDASEKPLINTDSFGDSLAVMGGPTAILSKDNRTGATADALRRHIAVPLVRAAQKYVGHPVVEALVKKNEDMNAVSATAHRLLAGWMYKKGILGVADALESQAAELSAEKPVDELMIRSAGQLVGGPEVLNAMDEREVLEASNLLEKHLGVTGAAYAQALATELPKAPLLLVSTPLAESATAVARAGTAATELPLLTRLWTSVAGGTVGGAMENAALNLPTSLAGSVQADSHGKMVRTDKTFGEAGAEGAMIGGPLSGAMHGGGEAVSEVIKKVGPEVIGAATRRAMKGLGAELERIAQRLDLGDAEVKLAFQTATGRTDVKVTKSKWDERDKASVYLFGAKDSEPVLYKFSISRDGMKVSKRPIKEGDFDYVQKIKMGKTSYVATPDYVKVEPGSFLKREGEIIDELDYKRAIGARENPKVPREETPSSSAKTKDGLGRDVTEVSATDVRTKTDITDTVEAQTKSTRGATDVIARDPDMPSSVTGDPAVIQQLNDQLYILRLQRNTLESQADAAAKKSPSDWYMEVENINRRINNQTELANDLDVGPQGDAHHPEDEFGPGDNDPVEVRDPTLDDAPQGDVDAMDNRIVKAESDRQIRKAEPTEVLHPSRTVDYSREVVGGGQNERALPPSNAIDGYNPPYEVTFNPGQPAWYRKAGTTGAPETVSYLEPDIAIEGNAIVVRNDGDRAYRDSIPMSELYPQSLAGFSDAPVASIPVENPSPEAIDLIYDRVADAKAKAAADLAGANAELIAKKPSLISRFMDFVGLNSHHHQVNAAVEDLVLRGQSNSSLMNDQMKIEKQLKSIVNTDVDSIFDRQLTELADGSKTPEQIWKEDPQALDKFQKIRDVFKNYLDEVQFNHDRMTDLLGNEHEGLVDLPTRDEMDRYLAVMYRAYTMPPGQWAKIAPDSVIEEAARFLAKQAQARGEQKSALDIANELREMMNKEDPFKAFQNSEVGRPWKNLKHKENIPPVLKRLMGEETSFMIRMSTSLAKQRAIINNLEVWGDIVNFGNMHGGTLADGPGKANPLWSPGRREDLSVEIPDNPLLFGKAAGGWAHEDLRPLIQAAKSIEQPFELPNVLMGIIKGNLVGWGGAKPWVNAFMENYLFNSTLCGGYGPWEPHKAGKYLRDAMLDYLHAGELLPASIYKAEATAKWNKKTGPAKKNRSLDVDPENAAARVLQAKKLGVDTAGYYGNEVARPNSEFFRALRLKLLREGGEKMTAPSVMKIYVETLKEHAKALHGSASHYYDFIDRAFKYSQFKALVDKGMTPIDAAKRINRYFPNMKSPGKFADKLRRSNAGYLAMFATTRLEQMRVSGNAIEELLGTNPNIPLLPGANKGGSANMLGRVAASTLLGSVMWSAMRWKRRENGISDTEANGRLTSGGDVTQSRRSFATTVLPWRQEPTLNQKLKGEKGSLIAVDTGEWFWGSRLLKKDPDDSFALAIPTNLMLEVSSGGAAEGPMKAIIADATGRDFNDFKKSMLPGQEGIGKLGEYLLRNGMVPGVAMRGYDALRKTGAVGTIGKLEEPMSPGTAALNLLGVSASPLSNLQFKASKIQRKQELDQYVKNKIKINKSNETEEEKAKLRAANKDFKKQSSVKYKERSQANKQANKESKDE